MWKTPFISNLKKDLGVECFCLLAPTEMVNWFFPFYLLMWCMVLIIKFLNIDHWVASNGLLDSIC